jgi:hypothetical protein
MKIGGRQRNVIPGGQGFEVAKRVPRPESARLEIQRMALTEPARALQSLNRLHMDCDATP